MFYCCLALPSAIACWLESFIDCRVAKKKKLVCVFVIQGINTVDMSLGNCFGLLSSFLLSWGLCPFSFWNKTEEISGMISWCDNSVPATTHTHTHTHTHTRSS
jgi:hypothetical protein